MGWLFGNKDNSRTETKTVNDNGKLKELQLTITGPDSTMVVTGDEYRTTVPLRGNQPVAAEEVSIERKAPNGMWLNSLIPFYDGDVKGTQKKARSLWQLPEVEGKSQGGWMNKFQNGGSTQPTQDLAMKELMAIVQQAATELQSNKPGQGVQTLAQIANDPQGSQLLDVLVQQVPEAGQIVEAVMKMVGAFKCGGKTKKKVKKGAKGCVPCKKLMRVGGKLVNVLTDCEGNIISKHQTGGWIRKGNIGLNTQSLFSNKYRTAASIAPVDGVTTHFYMDTNGKLQQQNWDATNNTWSNVQTADMDRFNQFVRDNSDVFVLGFLYDPTSNSGYFSNETDARTALGDTYDSYNVVGKTYNGVTAAGGNKALGYTGDGSVTANEYVTAKGGFQNAMQAEDDIFKAKRRANRQLRRMQIKNINQGGTYDPDGDGPALALTGGAARLAIRADRRKYMNNVRSARVYNQAAILNTQTPKLNTVTPVSMSGTSSTTTSLPENTTLAKQGGWLNKFQDGGHMDYETKSNISGTTWEQRIDRDNTGAIYRYNPGRTSHVVTLQTTGLPAINSNRFVKYGEERYYLTDPKTGRVVKIEGPTIDQRVEELAPVVNSSIIEDQITPEQDIFIFPGGFTKVIPTTVQKEVPKKSKKPAKPEKNIEGPKQEVPAQPNDNTSTSGSKTPGNIRQGNYPKYESIPVPDGYDPSNEWVEERDLVNGQVRVTWRNKKTGEIRRVKPYKYGGWLNKYKDGGETEPKLEQYKFYRNELSTPAGYGVIHEGFYPSYTIGDRTGITYDFDSSPRWGRNIYTSPNGNDTIYFTTSDPYKYIDNVSGPFVMVGTPHVSQKAAKKGWFEQLFGLRAPIVVEEKNKEAFNRAKKELK